MIKYTVDGAAVAVAAGTWADFLPKIAALFTVIWLGIQIGEWAVKKIKEWRSKKNQS